MHDEQGLADWEMALNLAAGRKAEDQLTIWSGFESGRERLSSANVEGVTTPAARGNGKGPARHETPSRLADRPAPYARPPSHKGKLQN